jgi:hypothetical protein
MNPCWAQPGVLLREFRMLPYFCSSLVTVNSEDDRGFGAFQEMREADHNSKGLIPVGPLRERSLGMESGGKLERNSRYPTKLSLPASRARLKAMTSSRFVGRSLCRSISS